MTFPGAVQSVLRQYANFRGRAAPSEFWWWYLFTVLVDSATTGIDRLTDAALGFSYLGTVVSLGLLVPALAVSVRRLHDSDLSGWWLAAPISTALAGVGAIVAGVVTALAGAFSNAHDTPGLAIALFVAGSLTLLASLAVNLVLMLRPSTRGPNRFGPRSGPPDEHPPAGPYAHGPGYAPLAWGPSSPASGTPAPPPPGAGDSATGPGPG